MINLSEKGESHVIPQWLEFHKAISVGELSYNKKIKTPDLKLKEQAIQAVPQPKLQA